MQDNDDVCSKLKYNETNKVQTEKQKVLIKKPLIQVIKLRIKYLMLVEQLPIILLIQKMKMFENKLPDVSRLVNNTVFNTKITEIEKKFLLC